MLVRVEGWYVDAFETSAMARGTEERGNAVYLTEPAIWVDRATVIEERNCFIIETMPPSEFCEVTVEGIFDYGEGYGHIDAYKYRIRPQP